MCENMVILCHGSASEVCAVSKVLRSVSDGRYTESDNGSVSDEEKGRRDHAMRILYLRRREMRPRNGHLISEEKGDAPTQRTPPFYLTCTKKTVNRIFSMRYSLCQPATMPIETHAHTYVFQRAPRGPDVRSTAWSTSCLTFSKHLDCRRFKSW
jgi:hypothetical protein